MAGVPSSSDGSFLVAAHDGTVLIRIVGLGTMNNSMAFQQFAVNLAENGLAGVAYEKFVFDLAECQGFDSTFMGILLDLSLKGLEVLAVNANDGHRKTLSEVGIAHVIRICEVEYAVPEIPFEELEQKALGSDERVRMILQAHENFVRVDPRNAAQFGTFIDLLRKEIDASEE